MKADWGRKTREYDKEFAQYQKDGLDLIYRCDRCGKMVLRYHIQNNPHGCKRCGSRKVVPAMQDLTQFGIRWYRFWNWFYEQQIQKYIKKIRKVS